MPGWFDKVLGVTEDTRAEAERRKTCTRVLDHLPTGGIVDHLEQTTFASLALCLEVLDTHLDALFASDLDDPQRVTAFQAEFARRIAAAEATDTAPSHR